MVWLIGYWFDVLGFSVVNSVVLTLLYSVI